jgi:uncharacterized membrane protein
MRELGEAWLTEAVLWLRLAVEAAGAAVIAVGILVALVGALRRTTGDGHVWLRITLARYLALALEFQLAADVLTTAVAPSWEELGKLAATAAIRTALNFFLAREVRELERAEPPARNGLAP